MDGGVGDEGEGECEAVGSTLDTTVNRGGRGEAKYIPNQPTSSTKLNSIPQLSAINPYL